MLNMKGVCCAHGAGWCPQHKISEGIITVDGRLLINTVKRTGPRCEPCGTPQEIVLYSDIVEPTRTEI